MQPLPLNASDFAVTSPRTVRMISQLDVYMGGWVCRWTGWQMNECLTPTIYCHPVLCPGVPTGSRPNASFPESMEVGLEHPPAKPLTSPLDLPVVWG